MLQDADVDDYLGAGSDHRAFMIRMRLAKTPGMNKHKTRKPKRGWTPQQDDDGKPTGFHGALDEGLRTMQPLNIDAITSTVVDAACEHEQKPRQSRQVTELASAIRTLIDERKLAINAEERRDISKKIQELLRETRQR